MKGFEPPTILHLTLWPGFTVCEERVRTGARSETSCCSSLATWRTVAVPVAMLALLVVEMPPESLLWTVTVWTVSASPQM